MRMRTFMALLLMALFMLTGAGSAYCAGADDILGLWYNEDKDAKIEVFKCGEKYCGKIVWMKNPDYPADSKDGAPGTPKLDHNNPDSDLKKMPRLGLEVVRHMVWAGGNKWEDGTVYDPNNGKTYSAKFTLNDPENLDLRGFIGFSLFGRTSHWTRNP